MNRNNIFIHFALAFVLILVAAFAGQLNRWRKEWRGHVGVVPTAEKKQPASTENIALSESHPSRPEILVKFKSGVSRETVERLTTQFHDRVEDRIENVPGLDAIDDLDDADAATLVSEYSALPEVEYAEPNYDIELDEAEGPLV